MKRRHHIVIVNHVRFFTFCCTLILLTAAFSYIAAASARPHSPEGHETVSVQYYHPQHFAGRNH